MTKEAEAFGREHRKKDNGYKFRKKETEGIWQRILRRILGYGRAGGSAGADISGTAGSGCCIIRKSMGKPDGGGSRRNGTKPFICQERAGSKRMLLGMAESGTESSSFFGRGISRELRTELKELGEDLETDGDAELAGRMYLHYGPEFVKQLNGVFAMAVVDFNKKMVFLYRDRIGVKPLFYTFWKDRLYFAAREFGQRWIGRALTRFSVLVRHGRREMVC